MGKASVKKNKNIYFKTREELGIPSRAAAAELLECIEESRIEKIENDRVVPHPEEVLIMSEKYKTPYLCNHYCSNECPIGKEYVPEIRYDNIHEVLVKMIVSLDSVNERKNRLMQILSDGQIQKEEIKDFVAIRNELEQISIMVESMQLWCEKLQAEGKVELPK